MMPQYHEEIFMTASQMNTAINCYCPLKAIGKFLTPNMMVFGSKTFGV